VILPLALLLALLVADTAPAQQRGAPPAKPPAPPAPSLEQGAPYEPELLRLSEVMGSLAYLRQLCEGAEAGEWRNRMAALIEAEGTTPARRERLTEAYNRGFRAYAPMHRYCTDASREAASRLAVDGERLSRALAGRYGG
jgi:uncharacterized protein (TIGR02301 family)